MRKLLAAVLALFVFSGPAHAWNFKGHFVVCRLAWLQMTDQQRAAVTAILKKHPHYDEFLAAKCPDCLSEMALRCRVLRIWKSVVSHSHSSTAYC
jgi:hypothetical protein